MESVVTGRLQNQQSDPNPSELTCTSGCPESKTLNPGYLVSKGVRRILKQNKNEAVFELRSNVASGLVTAGDFYAQAMILAGNINRGGMKVRLRTPREKLKHVLWEHNWVHSDGYRPPKTSALTSICAWVAFMPDEIGSSELRIAPEKTVELRLPFLDDVWLPCNCLSVADTLIINIRKFTQLRVLDLHGATIPVDPWNSVLESLSRLTNLDTLGLSDSFPGPGSDLSHLKSLVQLTDLDLSGCSMSGNEANLLACGLRPLSCLRTLNLRDCGINTSGLVRISESLHSSSECLSVVDLSGSLVFHEDVLDAYRNLFSKCTRLSHLDLRSDVGGYLRNVGYDFVQSLVKDKPRMQFLDLTGLRMPEWLSIHLCEQLLQCTSLTGLGLGSSVDKSVWSPRSVWGSNPLFGVRSGAVGFSFDTILKCGVKDGFKMLRLSHCWDLSYSKPVRIANEDRCNRGCFRCCGGDECVFLHGLANHIGSSSKLVQLELASNRIDDTFGFLLAGAVKACRHLQKLDVSNNRIKDTMALQLVTWLPDGMDIDLSFNCITEWGAWDIAKDLEQRKPKRLQLAGNELDLEAEELLCEIFEPWLLCQDLMSVEERGRLSRQLHLARLQEDYRG
mmetsp:Transcript_30561/g.47876  ORF Transcript_30561/g.47876 Transcript_30561/m.47876 type:complete len:619 (+) Transcript_30561:454-2310(+)